MMGRKWGSTSCPTSCGAGSALNVVVVDIIFVSGSIVAPFECPTSFEGTLVVSIGRVPSVCCNHYHYHIL